MSDYLNQLAEQSGNAAAGGIIGAGMGLLLEGHNDRRQVNQQKKLTEIQLAAEKQMQDYTLQNQLKLWENTSYSAQVAQMKKAGINPALLYGIGGGGGQSSNVGSPTVGAATAQQNTGEAMGLMTQQMQLGLLKAQKDNIEASTAKTKIEAAKTAGVDTQEGIMRMEGMAQKIDNQKVENEINKIELQYKDENTFWGLEKLKEELGKIGAELNEISYRNTVSAETLEEQKAIVRQRLMNMVMEKEVMHQGIQLSKEQINKLSADILQGWEGLSYEQRKTKVQENLSANQIDYAPIDRIIKAADVIANGVLLNKMITPGKVQMNKIGYNAKKSY